MAQRKTQQLDGESKRSVAQKARRARELKTISDLADENLALTDEWRTLLPEHHAAIKLRLLGGDTLRSICRSMGIEPGVVSQYIYDNPEYAAEINSYRTFGAHQMYDRLVDMIDDPSISPSDKMFAYKVISHLAPKLNRDDYGDQVRVEQSVTVTTPVMPDWFFGSVVDGQLTDDSDPTI
jgi:hypothetical protein